MAARMILAACFQFRERWPIGRLIRADAGLVAESIWDLRNGFRQDSGRGGASGTWFGKDARKKCGSFSRKLRFNPEDLKIITIHSDKRAARAIATFAGFGLAAALPMTAGRGG